MQKILVTGGAGFVGSNLISRLLSLGYDIRATLHNKDPQIVDSRIEYIQCDLLNKQDCDEICKCVDCVVMCAANTSGASVIENTPLVHVTPNVIVNTLMLDAAYSNSVQKFVFLSSNTVYPPVEFPVKESDFNGEIYEKYFCVGWMKRFSEILCEMYSTKIRRPMNCVIVRPGNLFGEYDDFEWETSHVIPSLIRKVVERHNPIEVWGDGCDVKDFLYIKDFIDGLIQVITTDTKGVVNIAKGQSYSIKEILQIICEEDGYNNATIVYNSSKPKMIPNRFIDISLAQKMLSFYPSTSLIEGLRNTIAWFRIQTQQEVPL